MVTTELGQCEWFIWDLRRSSLIERGQLDQVIGEFLQENPRAEPPALAAFLVAQGVLSQFQADRLLKGKTQGFVLGPFTLMDAVGAGSMGTVYKAQSKTDGKSYAVKVLPRRSMWNVRIARRKVRAFEACRHPAVVPFVDVGTAGGMHYLAWPFIEGESLDKFVQARGKLQPGLAAHFALQIAEGLEVCHQQALFHGLLKPSNLMLGERQQIQILDFGIGCLLAETEGESLVDTMSTANSVASGLDCASPESIMDPQNLTPAGDQYSLGCILYYCLTGQYPFPDGSSAEKMMAHQFKEPKPLRELNPEVTAELAEVVQRLMQKAPENRYAHAAEVVEALRPLAYVPSAASAARPAPPRAATLARAAEVARPAAAAPEPVAVSATAPTPKPQGNVNVNVGLPTRQSLRGNAPPPAAAPKSAPPEQRQPEEQRRFGAESTDERGGGRNWLDETVSPVTVVVIVIASAAVAWTLFALLF